MLEKQKECKSFYIWTKSIMGIIVFLIVFNRQGKIQRFEKYVRGCSLKQCEECVSQIFAKFGWLFPGLIKIRPKN